MIKQSHLSRLLLIDARLDFLLTQLLLEASLRLSGMPRLDANVIVLLELNGENHYCPVHGWRCKWYRGLTELLQSTKCMRLTASFVDKGLPYYTANGFHLKN